MVEALIITASAVACVAAIIAENKLGAIRDRRQ
jgi:hypothetical protein